METVLDVVPPFALQCVVVGSLVGLRGVGGACTYTHTHTEWGREGGGGATVLSVSPWRSFLLWLNWG